MDDTDLEQCSSYGCSDSGQAVLCASKHIVAGVVANLLMCQSSEYSHAHVVILPYTREHVQMLP